MLPLWGCFFTQIKGSLENLSKIPFRASVSNWFEKKKKKKNKKASLPENEDGDN